MNQESSHHTMHGHENHGHAHAHASALKGGVDTEWKTQQEIQADQGNEISLLIKTTDGKNITSFSTVHEEKMHMLVISHDLSSFQHLHPHYEGEGKFNVKAVFPRAGKYRVFADFTPEGFTQQLAVHDVVVEGREQKEEIHPDKELKKAVDDLVFELKFDELAAKKHIMMTFTITDNKGNDITELEPYLGSAGHVVIVDEKLDEFLHVHPQDESAKGPDVEYMTTFPFPGIYKIWGQFKYRGNVYTAPFVINVPQNN